MQIALSARPDALKLGDSEYFDRIIDISKERISTKELFIELSKYFNYEELIRVSTQFTKVFEQIFDWKEEEFKKALNNANHIFSFW